MDILVFYTEADKISKIGTAKCYWDNRIERSSNK